MEFDPPLRGAARISQGISRVWSTLWGSDRKALRLVVVDGNGQLVVRPPRWDLCTTVVKTEVSTVNAVANIDFGQMVDWVSISMELGPFHVQFSADNSTWRNRRVSISREWAAGFPGSVFEGFIRCRYLNFPYVLCLLGVTVTAIGETFPTE